MFLLVKSSFASELDQKLAQTAVPYVKYFKDRSLKSASEFLGFTRSFQLYLGGQAANDEAIIYYGAVSYDQSILARISLCSSTKDILDTYVSYAAPEKLRDPNNPLINCDGKYYGAGGQGDPIRYGLYRIVRILGRDIPGWYNSWDWIVDTGAAACIIIDALEAYQKTLNADYMNFAILIGEYILRLKDNDGGIRAGPRGMFHPQGSDFFWNLKSTEQNERCLYAFDALYIVDGNSQYKDARDGIKNWLKSMYNKQEHLFYCAATFINSNWIKSEIADFLATDVTAFAPLKMMITDTYFGNTQAERDAEVEAMFNAIERKTGFLDTNNRPLFFRFTTSQATDPVKGDYGSVEWSAQMALAYLRGAQEYAVIDWNKARSYLDKYNVLITSLETFFSAAPDDPDSKVAPYASYFRDKSVAWNVSTGTGYYTFNCQAALASAYYVFAKAGYDPTKLGGGTGIPASSLNLSIPWYRNTAPYNSTGAATAQMILNFIRTSAGAAALTQNDIYQYAKLPNPYGPELNPDEMDKALGHFDPYDTLVSNWSDSYDSLPGGNPYKGYNFSVDTYDPDLDADALNKYMRDICHWMAFIVTKENWWRDGDLTAEPNTPAAIPIYGSYNHWVVVKGFSVSANPCPEPRTNPWNTPDFVIYGFWIKDPLISGIGQDTYKTAAECATTYFLRLSTNDNYNGKLVQVAEPPLKESEAGVYISQPINDIANLEFIGVRSNPDNSNNAIRFKSQGINMNSAGLNNQLFVKKQGWRDLLPIQFLADSDCQALFNGTRKGKAVLVKRSDIENSDYYLVPFNKTDKKGRVLTSAVIILDADTGYFKEVSWTNVPDKFLAVMDRKEVINLITRYILNDFSIKLSKLPRVPLKNYFKRRKDFYRDYWKLLTYVRNADVELLWEPNNSYSLSPYQPYWKIDANGYIWYVTQESKVFSERDINETLEVIKGNRIYLKKFY